jgi:response regulator RpfG family c-di-GMP phosphodiesterase
MVRTLNSPPFVLVVDDDHLFGLLCARSLEKLGLQVICADNTVRAAQLAELHTHRIMLMLIDVVLIDPDLRLTGEPKRPSQDGAELLTLLKHRCPHAIGIQMSAYTTQELSEHGYHIQHQHFIQKPITPALLRSRVKTLLPDLKVSSKPILSATDIIWWG